MCVTFHLDVASGLWHEAFQANDMKCERKYEKKTRRKLFSGKLSYRRRKKGEMLIYAG